MNIRIECPGCQRPIGCRADQAGQVVSCADCGQRMRVPAAPPPPSLPPPPPPPSSRREPAPDDDDIRDVTRRAPSRRGRPVLPPGAPADVLGETLAEFSTQGIWLLCLAAFLVLVGVGFSLAGLFGEKARGLLVIAFIFFALAAIPCALGVMRLGRRVIVCDGGLVDCWAGRVRFWTWDEVDRFYMSVTRVHINGQYSHTNRRYDLRLSTGERRTYTGALSRGDELGALLGGEIARAKLTPCLEAMEKGEWIDFGRFALGREGIRADRDTMPWSEVEGLSVDKGILHIFAERGLAWESVEVRKVPNLQLLLRLGDHCKRAFA